MSKAHQPPVPPAQRSTKGPGSHTPGPQGDMTERAAEANKQSKERHLGEQGRQGNVKQNTTNQGYQQDR